MPTTPVLRMSPTRFPGGINTAEPYQAMANMGQVDRTRIYTDESDFFVYTAADWTVTLVGAGGTKALTAGAGGLLGVANSAGIADSTYYQRTVAAFTPVAGKRAFFKIRLKLDSVVLTIFQAGLILTDSTPLDATDGIYFIKPTAATATGDVIVRKNATTGSTTLTGVVTFVADTFTVLAFEYDGANAILFYQDDKLVAKLDASATYFPDADLALSFGFTNGSAVARTMTVDYVMAAIER